jgi:hypothetical protein
MFSKSGFVTDVWSVKGDGLEKVFQGVLHAGSALAETWLQQTQL